MRKRWKLFVVAVLALMGTPLAAATVTVTSTTDVSDGDTSSISALIATPGPDGVISLREAMTAANNTPGADAIGFNIPGSGVKSIYPLTSKLPPITEAVTIDGYTQPGASPNTLAVGDNAVLRIEVSGNVLPVPQLGTGFELDADNCVIKGLVINQFSGYSIPISPNHGAIVIHGNGNLIAGNFIGTNAAGTAYAETGMNAGRTNWVGISISGASSGNTMIGGPTPAARNIITGNQRTAINIQNSSGNVVAGNYIGTDINGAPMLTPWTYPTTLDGPIRIHGASNSTIGGTAAGAGNLTTVGVNLVTDAVSSPPAVLVPINNLILGNSFLPGGGYIRFVATPSDPGEDVDYNSGGANVSQDPLDADTGPNGLQNSPTVLSSTVTGATTSVSLRLTTAANQIYRVEVYTDSGRTLLGTTSLTTDAAGFAQTVLGLPAVATGQWITATASGPDGTSEFSVAHVVQDPAAAGLPLVVTNTNDSGAGSLRQAIFNANVQINGGTPDVITFNIPGAGVHTIQPTSALPVIGEGVLIDGYSQPGTSVNTLPTGNNAVLLIELSGASLSAASNTLLAVLGSDTTIRGLVMNRAGAGSSGSGTTLALGPLALNLKIEGNFIGTNAAGTAATANPATGIILSNVSNSTIGGTTPVARNLISGNMSGLILNGPETSGNVIAGNTIGTDASGTAAIPNTVYGILLGPYAANNLIGGTTAGARNVISGNGNGVVAAANWPGSLYTLGDGNRIQGNYIGTTADGNTALGNGALGQNTTGGIYIADLTLGAGTLTIGGTAAGAGNLISGNKGSGIVVTAYAAFPSGTVVVQGNRIGTGAAGTAANANQGDGIFHDFFALKLVVGGTSTAERNIISGNLGSGISGGSYFASAVIQGNYIGTDVTGSLPLGNGNHGVLATATGAQIGDAATPGSGNVIAFNTHNGVSVTGDVGNPVSGNSIFSNGGLGIDLGNNGVTPNDAGDPDTGPNNLQNFPVLTSALFGGGSTTIGGALNSTANTAFRVEFFSNTSCDSSGHGEGQTFLGFTTVTTDGSGNAIFNSLTFPVPPGQTVITATATDPAGNTSEFSACPSPPAPVPTLSVNSIAANEGNSGPTPFGFTVTLSAASASTVTVNFATADGTATAGSGDYVSTSGTVTFTPGQTSQPISVTVNGDTSVEPNETFFVNLTSPTNATITVAQGTGTIQNDEAAPLPTLSISSVAANEGNSGPTPFGFTVTLSAASASTVTVNFAIADGTATTASGDYVATAGTLTFAPGETSKPVTVTVNGDTSVEPNETFFVNLTSPTNATITVAQGTGTIQNDEAAPLPTLSISSVAANEGNSGPTPFGFTVTLSAASASTVTANFAAADGTATTASGDYVSISGTLTFTPGQTSQPIMVTVNGDTSVEPNETFFVNLTSPTNATIAVAQGTGTITDDDSPPAAIPTLSEWGKILLGLSLLALGAWRLGNHG